MSRSVSAPSSVTKTSPCWNGLIVPGSTLRYGSNFWTCTFRPRAFNSRPSDAAVMPFPSEETTPPVTKTYLVTARRPFPCQRSRALIVAAPRVPSRNRCYEVRRPSPFERREELGAAQHALELVAALEVVESSDRRVRRVAGDLLHAEVPLGGARDLGQVRDRDDLRAPGEPPERVGDRVRRHAADAGVDLVEDHRLPAGDGGDRERDARELAARGRVGDRSEGQ